jgi:hypothetical protein
MPINLPTPNADIFGFIPQAYAARLAASTGDPTVDALNAANLGMQARMGRGQQTYADLIRENSAYAAQAHGAEQQTVRQGQYLQHIPQWIDRGAGRAPNPAQFGVEVDPTVIAGADVAQRKGIDANTAKTTGEAAEKLTSAGVPLPTDYISGLITPAEQQMPTPVSTTTAPLTPGQTDSRIEANAKEAEARASMVAANRPASGGGDDAIKTVVNALIDRAGNPIPISQQTTTKGAGNSGGSAATQPAGTSGTVAAPYDFVHPRNPGKVWKKGTRIPADWIGQIRPAPKK